MSPGDDGRSPNLDILRMLLALEVLILHTHFFDTGKVLWLPVHPVAAFVCLSGLLIPRSFATATGWPHFAKKRLLRVGPALALALTLVLVMYGPRAAAGTFVFYATAGLVGSQDFDGPLWSLAVEEVLYAGHALIRAVRPLWRVETVAILFLSSCALYARFAPGHQNLERYFRLCAGFFIGNILSFYRERLRRANPIVIAILLAAALALVNALALTSVLSRLLYMFSDSLVCAAVVTFALATPQVRWKVHDISYGTYVYHAPLLVLLAGKLGLHGWALWASIVPLVLCLASLSWFWVERPALRFKNSRPTSHASNESLEVS
jgi:peptidoglycan/LPS O-acetylase OafA/YrhL